jgi:hypothetical protein
MIAICAAALRAPLTVCLDLEVQLQTRRVKKRRACKFSSVVTFLVRLAGGDRVFADKGEVGRRAWDGAVSAKGT